MNIGDRVVIKCRNTPSLYCRDAIVVGISEGFDVTPNTVTVSVLTGKGAMNADGRYRRFNFAPEDLEIMP